MVDPTAEGEEQPTRFSGQMSDAEALMWHVEQDPWFSSTIGTLLVCDRPIDVDRLRRRVAAAVVELPRLRERVVPRLGRVAPPLWRTDGEFELGHHLRHIALASPGSFDQLLELTTRTLQDPFDRSRPLWQFVVVDGLEGGRGALIIKLHHAVTDGEGGVKLAARYMDLERDPPSPGPHSAPALDIEGGVELDIEGRVEGDIEADIEADVEADVERHLMALAEQERGEAGDGVAGGLGNAARDTAGHVARRHLGIARRLAGDVVLTWADPARVPELAGEVSSAVRTLVSQLSTGDAQAHSPLWSARSRRRRLEVLDLPFRPVKEAAKRLGGSINDFFVTGAVGGAARYHEAQQTALDHLTITFVISTRGSASTGDAGSGAGEGGNAFTPSKAVLPAGAMSPAERFDEIRSVLTERRKEMGGGGLLAGVAGVANLLPTSVTTRFARAQAGGVDFATSNVRAAPFEVYIAGAKLLASYPVGPVAGTAWNITMLSYAGRLHLGVQVDPAAVQDVPLLVDSLAAAYDELFDAAGVDARSHRPS
jgi:WS/DGAT/MGAT family acyltransferase